LTRTIGQQKNFQVDQTMQFHQNMPCARLIKQAAGLLRTRFIPDDTRWQAARRGSQLDVCILENLRTEPNSNLYIFEPNRTEQFLKKFGNSSGRSLQNLLEKRADLTKSKKKKTFFLLNIYVILLVMQRDYR
jgi:hypothetical protein